MSERDRWWVRLVPTAVRTLPADLLVVAVLTLAAIASATVPVVDETPLRIVLGLPFVLFLPGYALIAALFPEEGEGPIEENDTSDDDEWDADSDPSPAEREGIDGIERVALSFGLSIAVVPLVGLVLNFTPWGIRLVPILVSVGGLTLALVAVAGRRRNQLPPDERFSVPWRDWLAAARTELLEPETRADAALNVLLAISVVLAVTSVGYAVAVPKQGESFTELYLLTEDGDGELVAADYPTEFVQGESKPLVIGIGNHEHEPVEYSLVIELQDVRFENNSTTVLEERELSRMRTRVGDNETWQTTYNVTPTMTGENLRLAFLLYKGDPPGNPTVANAYREVHLWVNVSNP